MMLVTAHVCRSPYLLYPFQRQSHNCIQMIGSDGQSQFDDNFNHSLNDTANSIHQQNSDQDNSMAALDPCLRKFIKSQLLVQLKLDDLEHQIFTKEKNALTLNPLPLLYFLPYHILVFDKSAKLQKIREDIQRLKKEYYSMSYFRQAEELYIKAHSKSQMVFYNIRVVKGDVALHRHKSFLDQKHLIDKLFQYYCQYYDRVYFQQTAILILYWAYQKQLLDEDFNEHVLKLLIICNFINFGYGIPNIVYQHLNNKEILKENNKMFSFARINQGGETQIDQALVNRYVNYTIQEKRGFYMTSKKKFMQIKEITPIWFPLVPLTPDRDNKEKMEVEKNIFAVLHNQREKMSICKNIFKIFKFLHNKFDKRMRLVVDFQEILAYRQEFSEHFQLQILHPVLNNRKICRLEGSNIRKLKNEINNIYEGFNRGMQPLKIMKEMFAKRRYQG